MNRREKKRIQELYNAMGGGFVIDQGGAKHGNDFMEYIKLLRLNIFKYENWPFAEQTPEELEIYLYEYDGVVVASIPEGKDKNLNVFIPFNFTKKEARPVTKLNAKLYDIQIGGDWNPNIKEYINKKMDWRDTFPFIFDNNMQKAPLTLQSTLFNEISGVFNAKKSNRINKNKQSMIEVDEGEAINTAYKLNYEMDDYSPFIIIERTKKNKDNPMTNAEIKQYTGTIPDYYNSLSTEDKEIKKDIFTINGIRSSQSAQKSSAQETDGQTSDKDRDTANYLLAMIKSRRKSLKNLRSQLGFKIQVKFTDHVNKFLKAAIEEEKKEEVKSD